MKTIKPFWLLCFWLEHWDSPFSYSLAEAFMLRPYESRRIFAGRRSFSPHQHQKQTGCMPRKRCNLPVKVRSGELSVHPGSKDPGCGATHKAKWIEKTP